MHYSPLDLSPAYPIGAIYENTAPASTSPWVMPGNYTAILTVENKTYSRTLFIKMDPRVKTSIQDLQLQNDLSLMAYKKRLAISEAGKELRDYRLQLQQKMSKANAAQLISLQECDKQAASFENPATGQSFSKLDGAYASLFNILESSDMPPTTQVIAAAKDASVSYENLWAKWIAIKTSLKKCLE